MRIALIVEGKTEKVFVPHLRGYLQRHFVEGDMPKFHPSVHDGRIPTHDKLRRVVNYLLNDGRRTADHVIALTDVYTGSRPPIFEDAAAAKRKMREWVGQEPRFHPHAAQYDFEAWLLPYWPSIQRLAGHDRAAPSGEPEQVNHDHPPAERIKEIFEVGRCRDSYIKPRDAARILRDNDLDTAIAACSELKALVNTILTVCGKPAMR